MILKGTTTIELTNQKTGEKRTIEEHNMVTNGISKILENIMGESNSPTYRLFANPALGDGENGTFGKERMMRMLTGGLILLDSTMTEDVNNFLPVEDVFSVGCASDIAYTGKNVMAGGYNVAESGALENGYKHVWDFGTNQANGQIACACLTTREGGFAGGGTYPYDSNYVLHSSSGTSNRVELYDTLSPRNANYYDEDDNGYMASFGVLYADYEKGQMICLSDINLFDGCASPYYPDDSRNDARIKKSIVYKRSIDLTIKRLPIRNLSILDNNRSNQTSNGNAKPELGFGQHVLGHETVQMPQSLSNSIDAYLTTQRYFRVDFYCDEGFIYILIYARKDQAGTGNGWDYVPEGDDIHVWKINVSDFSSTHITVKNTTGKKINLYGTLYNNKNNIIITNEYLLCSSYDEKFVYKISLNDSTNVSQVKWPDGTPLKCNNKAFAMQFTINKKVYCLDEDPATGYVPIVIDMKKGEARIRSMLTTEAVARSDDSRYAMYVQKSKGIILFYCHRQNYSSYSEYVSFGTLPEIFITINNLSSPVIKTSAETMKVTYTLTLADS